MLSLFICRLNANVIESMYPGSKDESSELDSRAIDFLSNGGINKLREDDYSSVLKMLQEDNHLVIPACSSFFGSPNIHNFAK